MFIGCGGIMVSSYEAYIHEVISVYARFFLVIRDSVQPFSTEGSYNWVATTRLGTDTLNESRGCVVYDYIASE
ncbi:hypothetical protein ACHQM5_022695 [Ranunculus cassubicifolius]